MNWWFIPPRIVNMGMVDPSDLFGVTQFPQFIPKENPPRKSRGTLQGCDTQWTVWCFLLVYVVSIFSIYLPWTSINSIFIGHIDYIIDISSKTLDISTINPRYCSYVHQLSDLAHWGTTKIYAVVNETTETPPISWKQTRCKRCCAPSIISRSWMRFSPNLWGETRA